LYKVANNHQDESFSIAIGGVTDEEGEALPNADGLTVEVTSSDDAVVGVTFDPSTNSGVAHFGHSGVASLNAAVKNAKGDILGSGAADFTRNPSGHVSARTFRGAGREPSSIGRDRPRRT